MQAAQKHHRDDATDQFEGLSKILRLAFPAEEPRADAPVERRGPGKRDMAAALDLVNRAADAISATEERARELEARTQALAQRATEELKTAEERIRAAEALALAAEVRAQEAEERAKEAEEWLARVHDLILDKFSRAGSSTAIAKPKPVRKAAAS
jgi:hypothetical protein